MRAIPSGAALRFPNAGVPRERKARSRMKKLIVLVIVCLIGWKAYTHYEEHVESDAQQPVRGRERVVQVRWPYALLADDFVCRGDVLLKNCPGVKMDGNGDGVPCEKQWCR